MTQLKAILQKDKTLINLLSSLILFAAFACTLVITRMSLTDHITYSFLIWNLILAWIPLFFSISLLFQSRTNKSSLSITLLLGGMWLLFYPNAPYIITDLVHVKARTDIPFWFDQILIMSFILNSLLVGFLSLAINEALITQHFNKWAGRIFVLSVSILSGFGIYLGRYERWNSWDIFQDLPNLLSTILTKILHPTIHPKTYGVTILFSTFLLIGYLIFKNMTNLQLNLNNNDK